MHYVTLNHWPNKFDHISVSYVQKPPRGSLKLYLLLKTFEISKLKNYKSDINETCPRYVPADCFNITKMRISMNGREGRWGTTRKTPENAMKLRGT